MQSLITAIASEINCPSDSVTALEIKNDCAFFNAMGCNWACRLTKRGGLRKNTATRI